MDFFDEYNDIDNDAVAFKEGAQLDIGGDDLFQEGLQINNLDINPFDLGEDNIPTESFKSRALEDNPEYLSSLNEDFTFTSAPIKLNVDTQDFDFLDKKDDKILIEKYENGIPIPILTDEDSYNNFAELLYNSIKKKSPKLFISFFINLIVPIINTLNGDEKTYTINSISNIEFKSSSTTSSKSKGIKIAVKYSDKVLTEYNFSNVNDIKKISEILLYYLNGASMRNKNIFINRFLELLKLFPFKTEQELAEIKSSVGIFVKKTSSSSGTISRNTSLSKENDSVFTDVEKRGQDIYEQYELKQKKSNRNENNKSIYGKISRQNSVGK